jgi:hypothetical protein
METINSCETSVHARSTRRHIPEDGILPSHRRENLKSCIIILFSTHDGNQNRSNGNLIEQTGTFWVPLLSVFLLGLLFCPEDEAGASLRNDGGLLTNYTMLQPR